MTDKTATQNLTRTQSTDDPKQVQAYLETLATEIDQRMAAHFHDLGRSVRPPFCVARLTNPTVVDSAVVAPGASFTGSVPFDTVEIDTAGMIDLSANAYTITPPEPGYYWCGGYALTNGFGSNAADVYATVQAGGRRFNDPRHDALNGFIGSGGDGMALYTTVPAALPPSLTVGYTGSFVTTTTTVFFAELWCMKMRDL